MTIAMKLLLAPDYVSDATKAINKAKQRVILMSMVIADQPASHDLLDALSAAAKRGVEVQVTADTFTFGEINGGFLWMRYNSRPIRSVTNMVKKLKSAGVRFNWLGRTKTTMFTGRTHSKWCLVDDTVYCFGGVNILQSGIAENADYMFKTESTELADRIVNEYQRILASDRNGNPLRNRRLVLPFGNVLVDGGIAGSSIIYKRACDLAKEAKSVTLVSQYPPTGKLAKLIRQTRHSSYINRPEHAKGLNRLVIKYSQWRDPVSTLYQRKRYIHAKFIIFTMKDNTKIAISGSHNFNYSGVLFGTREIALETKDQKIIGQLEEFLKNEIE